MYQEFILSLLILFIIYFLFYNDSRIGVEAFNGKIYKVKHSTDKQFLKQKADYLAELDTKAHKIVNHMYDNNLPTGEISKRTHSRFSNAPLCEVPSGDNSAAFTINKGPINLCIFKDGKFNDKNDAFFVILHELAHIMSNSFGHGDEFKQNFNFIVKLAVKLDLWKDREYEKKPEEYCGVKITTSPCDNETCKNENLEYYFKESLLDYK